MNTAIDSATAAHNDSDDLIYGRSADVFVVFRVIISTFGYMLVFILGVGGNCCVVYVFRTNRRMRSPTNTFLFNLALADLLVVIFCLPFQYYSTLSSDWIFGRFLCKLVPYLQGVSVGASIYSLVAIAIERCFSICCPMKYVINHRRCKMVCVCVWLLAVLLMVPWIIYFDLVPVDDENSSSICMELWPSEVVGNVFFLTINVGFCYLIPLSVIIVCYSYIWNCVNERIVPGNELNSHYAMLRRCKMKVTGMTLRVIILFAISWLWLYLVFLWIKLDFPYSDVAQAFIPIAQWLGVSNSCVNPILYAYYNSKFNVGFVSIVMKNSCCCKPKTYYSVASQIYRKRADNSKKPNIRMTVAVSQNVEQRDRTRVGRQQHPDLPQYPRNRCVKVKKTLSLDPEFFLDRKSDYPDFVIESELDKIFPS